MAWLLWREFKVLHPQSSAGAGARWSDRRSAQRARREGSRESNRTSFQEWERLRRTARRHPSKVGAVVARVFLRIQSHSSTPCLGALRERICGTVNGVRHET